MKKPKDDGTNRYRIKGTKELLNEALEIGQNSLSIIENEIVLAVLVNNLAFSKIAKDRELTSYRVKQIYQIAFSKLIEKVIISKQRALQIPKLQQQIFELETIVKTQSLAINKNNEETELLHSLSEEQRNLLMTRINETNLSARAKSNCVYNDIITVKDLVSLSPGDLLKTRNLGKITYDEIELFLSTNGLHWSMFRK